MIDILVPTILFTFVEPIFPLPFVLISIPHAFLVIKYPVGIEPNKKKLR